MCFNTDDEQDVKNIPQDEYKIYHFSNKNIGSKKNANENSISRSQGKCLTSCYALTTFGEDNCEKFSSKLKTSNGELKKLLPMWREIHEMIFVEPNVSGDRELIKLQNKDQNNPEVINMTARNNTRQKVVVSSRDGLKTQSKNYTNNDVSNECSIKKERNKLCYSRENPACYDNLGIFSVGYSNGDEPRNMKEQKRINKICNIEDNNQDRLVCQSSNFINPAMEKGNSERKWRMVYADRIYKSQTLHPCPTCGRKFNDEAATRHFPICLKGKEKRTLALIQEQKKMYSSKIPSNPQLITLNVNGNIDKKEEPLRKVTKIDSIFQKTVRKQTPVKDENINPSTISSIIPIVAEPKMILLDSNGTDYNNKDQVKHPLNTLNTKKTNNKLAILQSESIKKSATIWRKSVKEFDKSNKKSSLSKKQVEDANGNRDVIPEVESPQTWNGNRAFGKFPGAHAGFNNEFRSTSFQKNEPISETVPKTKPPKNLNINAFPTNNNIAIMNDLDIIPENIPIKKDRNNTNLKINVPKKKISVCGICGSNVKEDNLENHLEFCLRIKRLESSFSKETSAEGCIQAMVKLTDTPTSTTDYTDTDYCLFRNAGDTSHAKGLKTIVSLKCPCCFTLLDLCKTN